MGWFTRKGGNTAADGGAAGAATKLSRSVSGSKSKEPGATLGDPSSSSSSKKLGKGPGPKEVVILDASADEKQPARKGGHTVTRSRANVGKFLEDYVAPPEFKESHEPSPSYLRGPVLRLYMLKQQVLARVNAIVSAPGGLVERHGFHGSEKGGAKVAADLLVSDLVGGAGAVWLSGPEEAAAELHERVFENYNRWARMVSGVAAACDAGRNYSGRCKGPQSRSSTNGRSQPLPTLTSQVRATCVYSLSDDPDKAAILASLHAAYEARQSAMRERLKPKPVASSAPVPTSGPGGGVGVRDEERQRVVPPAAVVEATRHTASGSSSVSTGKATPAAATGTAPAAPTAPSAAPADDSNADSTGGSSGGGGGGGGGGSHHGLGIAYGGGGGGGKKEDKEGSEYHHHHHHGHHGHHDKDKDEEAALAGDKSPDLKKLSKLAARALQQGARPLVEVEIRASTQPGSDVTSRLTDLALWYCIRAEAANLRFMPE